MSKDPDDIELKLSFDEDEENSMEIGEIETFPNYEQVQKCIYGKFYDRKRIAACFELAKECNRKLHSNLTQEDRYLMRQSLIDEVEMRYSLTGKEVEIDKKDYRVPERLPTLYDEGFDADAYVEKHMRNPMGMCPLALYGAELQFMSEIGVSPIQIGENAEILRDIDRAIFDETARIKPSYMDGADKYWKSLTVDERAELLKRAGYATKKERIKIAIRDNLKGLMHEGENFTTVFPLLMKYLHENIEIDEIVYGVDANSIPSDVKWERCEPLNENPFVEKDKYQYCTKADLANSQEIILRKFTKVITEGKKKDLEEFKKTIKILQDKKNILTNKERWNNLTKDEQQQVLTHIVDLSTMARFKQTELPLWQSEINAIASNVEDRIRDFERLVSEIEEERDKGAFKRTANLDCWHNFYQYMHVDKRVVENLREYTHLLMSGEKSLEDFVNFIRAYQQGAEWSIEIFSPDQAPTTVHKSVEYMPVRFRIFGSQAHTFMKLQQDIYTTSIRDIVDPYFFETIIEQGFDVSDRIAMEKGSLTVTQSARSLIDFVNANEIRKQLFKSMFGMKIESAEPDTLVRFIRERETITDEIEHYEGEMEKLYTYYEADAQFTDHFIYNYGVPEDWDWDTVTRFSDYNVMINDVKHIIRVLKPIYEAGKRDYRFYRLFESQYGKIVKLWDVHGKSLEKPNYLQAMINNINEIIRRLEQFNKDMQYAAKHNEFRILWNRGVGFGGLSKKKVSTASSPNDWDWVYLWEHFKSFDRIRVELLQAAHLFHMVGLTPEQEWEKRFIRAIINDRFIRNPVEMPTARVHPNMVPVEVSISELIKYPKGRSERTGRLQVLVRTKDRKQYAFHSLEGVPLNIIQKEKCLKNNILDVKCASDAIIESGLADEGIWWDSS